MPRMEKLLQSAAALGVELRLDQQHIVEATDLPRQHHRLHQLVPQAKGVASRRL